MSDYFARLWLHISTIDFPWLFYLYRLCITRIKDKIRVFLRVVLSLSTKVQAPVFMGWDWPTVLPVVEDLLCDAGVSYNPLYASPDLVGHAYVGCIVNEAWLGSSDSDLVTALRVLMEQCRVPEIY